MTIHHRLRGISSPWGITFLTNKVEDSKGANGYQFNNVDLGDPHPNRYVVVVATSYCTEYLNALEPEMTLDGQQMDAIVWSNYGLNASIHVLHLPEGNSADLILKYGNRDVSSEDSHVAVYRLIHPDGQPSEVDDKLSNNYSGPSQADGRQLSLNSSGGGVAVIGTITGSGLSPTLGDPVNFTELYELDIRSDEFTAGGIDYDTAPGLTEYDHTGGGDSVQVGAVWDFD